MVRIPPDRFPRDARPSSVLTWPAVWLAAQLLAAAPLTREGAAQEAHRELQRGVYDAAQPSLLARVVRKVVDVVRSLLSHASNATPGGALGLLTVILLLVLAGFVVFRLGPLR